MELKFHLCFNLKQQAKTVTPWAIRTLEVPPKHPRDSSTPWPLLALFGLFPGVLSLFVTLGCIAQIVWQSRSRIPSQWLLECSWSIRWAEGCQVVVVNDFPFSLHQHQDRQLLVYVVSLLEINRSSETGHTRCFIKVCVHKAEPLNELADLLAGEAAKYDPARSIAGSRSSLLESEGTWVEWDEQSWTGQVGPVSASCREIRH